MSSQQEKAFWKCKHCSLLNYFHTKICIACYRSMPFKDKLLPQQYFKKWLKLKNSNYRGSISRATAINQHEIINVHCIYDPNLVYRLSIEKYNVNTNEWTEVEPKLNVSTSANWNPEPKKLLYITRSARRLGNKLEFANIASDNIELETVKISNHDIKFGSRYVYTNNEIHAFESEPPYHLKYNAKTDTFDKIFDFREYEDENEKIIKQIHQPFPLYIPTRNMIVLIGGYDLFETKFAGIWVYSLVTKKWKKIKTEIDFIIMGTSAVLTTDDRNIIIVGGQTRDPNDEDRAVKVDTIYVLDISEDDTDKWMLKKSFICLTKKSGNCHI